MPEPSRSIIDRLLATLGWAFVGLLVVCAIAWFPARSIVGEEFLWASFAAALVGLWVAALVRVVAHIVRRKRLGASLIARRRAFLNAGEGADDAYLADRAFVLGPSPFAWLTKQLLASSLISLVFIFFIHGQLGQGFVRGAIAVAILTLLAVPISFLASILDARVARSDHALTIDI